MKANPGGPQQSQNRIQVIGIGNPDRGDDAVGLRVARGVRERLPLGVDVIEVTGALVSLLDTWRSADSVIVVDAAVSRGNPGDIHRFEPNRVPLPAEAQFPSTHGIGVAETIGLAKALGSFPERFLVYAIEGERFDPGSDMSPEVRAASDTVRDEIVDQVGLWEREVVAGGHA